MFDPRRRLLYAVTLALVLGAEYVAVGHLIGRWVEGINDADDGPLSPLPSLLLAVHAFGQIVAGPAILGSIVIEAIGLPAWPQAISWAVVLLFWTGVSYWILGRIGHRLSTRDLAIS